MLSLMALVRPAVSASRHETSSAFINHKRSFQSSYLNPSVPSTPSTPSQVVDRATALNYREEDITDRYWHSALVADSIRLELQPSHDERVTMTSKNSEDLFETAKAFLPVAIEIGAVAALAANIPVN